MINRKGLRCTLVWLVVAYCSATLPLALLVFQSDYYRFVTVQEISRKLAHIRPLTYAFIGDSLTAQEESWGSLLGRSPFCAINLGTPGYTISQVGGELANAARLNPRFVSILAGTNDYNFGHTDEQILGDFKLLLQSARDLGCQFIVVTSIPLHADSAHDARLIALNLQLRTLVEAGGWRFLDLNSAILKDSNRAELYQSDGLHFSRRMYKLWAQELRELTKA